MVFGDRCMLPEPVDRCSTRVGHGLLVGLACLALAACGGGGGDGGGPSNQAPTASFTATPSSGSAPLTVAFNAAASSDPDGSIASYSWNFGDNSTDTGVAPRHTYTTAGTYQVTLTVTDDRGATTSTRSTILVAPNSPPTATFTAAPTSGVAPLTVTFNASGSTDPDGSITSYAWDFGDNTTGSGVITSHTYQAVGTFTARLTVTDNSGAQSAATLSVTATPTQPPVNIPPSAAIVATPTSGPAPLTVAFNASGSSDPDGTITGYSWNFGDNSTGSGVAPSHTYATAGTFTVTLVVTDNGGASAVATSTISVSAPQASVTVSGRITFERVPFSTAAGDGLDYTRTFEAPAREVEVDLVRSSDQAILAATATDTNGNYSLTAPSSTDVFVRAKALTRHAATTGRPASWDVRVRNNTNGNALYVLDGSVFNTGSTDQTRNLKAATGWGGGFAGVYTGVRAAAPFAVLDTIYSSIQFVVAQGSSGVQFPALSAYWSPDNRSSDDFDPASGNIVTTLYQSGGTAPGIYVLGNAGVDTDEFDQHVIAHESQHYLEDAISRADTVGGSHSLDERLDMRVAFSEGFANAFSGMALNDPVYRDSFGTAQGDDFGFSVESRGTSAPGWYSEASVQRIAWDLFDAANDGADTVSLGYAPMFSVFTSELRNGVPLTSLFPFITALKQRAGVPAALVDQLVEAERVAGTSLGIVSTTMDAYATTETHSGVAAVSADLVLPVYAPVTLNGPDVRLCASSSIETSDGTVQGTYNKLGNRRFLRFSMPSARTIRVTVSCSAADASCAGTPVPDPDFVLSRASSLWFAESSTPRLEQLDVSATAGDYVLEVYEWTHVEPGESAPRGRTCMTVNITG